MCVVSAVGDNWKDSFPNRWPTYPDVTREEFDALKKEVKELKELLLAAKKFDEATGQPNCEMDEKIDLIKKVAKELGIDMTGVFN